MRRSTKICLVTATFLVLLGCIIWTGAMTMLKWDFSKFSTMNYETNRYEFRENVRNIHIETITADVRFLPAEDEQTAVVCYEQTKVKHAVTVENGTLTVKAEDTRKWYEYIGINFRNPVVTVYLPQDVYGALSVESETGDVHIGKEFTFDRIQVTQSTGDVTVLSSALEEIRIRTSTGGIHIENVTTDLLDLAVSTGSITLKNMTCGDVNIRVSTGDVTATNLYCSTLASQGSTGDVLLKNVIAQTDCTITRSTGDVRFESFDAGEITVKTSTGDVKGTMLTEKVFIVRTDTGKINVPKTAAGGKCEITTSTGDIRISLC